MRFSTGSRDNYRRGGCQSAKIVRVELPRHKSKPTTIIRLAGPGQISLAAASTSTSRAAGVSSAQTKAAAVKGTPPRKSPQAAAPSKRDWAGTLLGEEINVLCTRLVEQEEAYT